MVEIDLEKILQGMLEERGGEEGCVAIGL